MTDLSVPPEEPEARAAATASRQFRHGFGLLPTALRLIVRERALWPWVTGPVAVTLMLVGASTVWVVTAGDVLVRPFVPDVLEGNPAVWWWVDAGLRAILWVLLVVVSWFVGSMVSAPFHDRLSARVEHLVRGEPVDAPPGAGIVGDVVIGLLHSSGALVLYLGLSCLLLPANLLPGLGSLGYAAASFWLTGLFLAREVLDYSASRRRLSFVAKFRLLRDNLAVTSGLGLAIALVVTVPFTTLLSMPVAVVAGTLLWCELDADGLIPS